MTVRRTFAKGKGSALLGLGTDGNAPAQPRESESDDASSFEMVTNDETGPKSQLQFPPSKAATTMMERVKGFVKKGPESTEDFGVSIKSGVLYHYTGTGSTKDPVVAITLADFRVAMENVDGPYQGRDGAIFAKRNACVLRFAGSSRRGLSVLQPGMSAEINGHTASEKGPFFYFSRNNSR